MKKGLSLLLAASVAFSAFSATAFAATPQTAEEKYQALVEAGIFEGFPDGQAHLDENMTRAQAAKIVAVLLGLEENEAAASIYTDLEGAEWAAGFIGAATEAGVLEGRGNGVFDPSANVTIQELAKIMVEALGLEVDATATAEGADEWAQAYVAAAVAAGLIPQQSDYTAPASRTILVEASYTAYASQEEPEIEGAVATPVGAKKIEVKFGAAIDESKATFAVKKGTINLNVASKTVSEDKKTVTLELSSKLTEGDYTVTVGGVAATDLTSTFKAENEKVTKIEFKTSNAPLALVGNNDALVDDLSIPYQVLNQYGENVTKTTTLTSNFSSDVATINASAGTLDIEGTYKIGDVVAVTLVHADTATSAVATLNVVAQAKVGEIDITGLYNKDNKTLDEDTDLAKDAFYVLVDLKDQYGNEITSAARAKSDIILSESNNTIVDVNSTVPANSTTTLGEFEKVTVNGTDKLALKLNKPENGIKVGQSTLTLISNTTGKSDTFNIVVAEAVRVDSINLINPGSIYVGEDAYVAVEAFDKQGNAVTSVSTLNNATKGVKVTVNGNTIANAFVLKDGVVSIKVPKSEITTTGMKSIIAMTSSNKVATLNVDAKAKAVPTIIRGVDADFAKTYLTNAANKEISYTNLIVEDQYGRVMADDDVKAWLKGDADRQIKISETDGDNNVSFTTAAISVSAGDVETKAVFGTNDEKGTEKITFALTDDAGKAIAASTGEATLRVTDGSEYTSYSVDSVGFVYDEFGASKTEDDDKTYTKTVKVYGLLNDGSKVQLAYGADYVVHALSNTTVNGDVYADGKFDISLDANSALSYGDKKEIVVPITVTIGKTGQQLTQDVTISKEAPKVASVKVVAGTNVDGSAKTSIDLAGAATTFNVNQLTNGTNYSIIVTDQYGVKATASGTGTIAFKDGTNINVVSFTVTPVNNASIKIAGNGTVGATVSEIGQGEEFDVTIVYAGGASTTVRVKG